MPKGAWTATTPPCCVQTGWCSHRLGKAQLLCSPLMHGLTSTLSAEFGKQQEYKWLKGWEFRGSHANMLWGKKKSTSVERCNLSLSHQLCQPRKTNTANPG